MDAGGGGVLRRNRAAPASGAERWLMAEIALEAGSPWIGKIGSFHIPSLEIISLASWACWLGLLLQNGLLFCSGCFIVQSAFAQQFLRC